MRTFTDGNGNDSTSAVLAYLAANHEYTFADLYLIGELEDPQAIFLTNWESPLAWPIWGTFLPSGIKSRSRIKSEVLTDSDPTAVDGGGGSSFSVSNLDFVWAPKLTAFGTTVLTQNFYQKAQNGWFDNKKFRLWRAIMPTPGDVNTYGATPYFGGWIQDTTVQRGEITFSVQSFLNVVTQKVPPNVIEASNAQASYSGAVPVLLDNETNLPIFTVANPVSSATPLSPTAFLGDCVSPTAHKIYNLNRFALGYVQFLPGSTLAGYWSPIATNFKFDSGAGNSPEFYNEFNVYAAFPWVPSPGDRFYASTQLPLDYATALSAATGIFKGFPFVPQPTAGV
ncbi:MAG TPA: hypothetical protein VND65_06910 [Candidatus Binatia bacterium]|nr:hypothetical protein [Candidatus Binatia bacterium]